MTFAFDRALNVKNQPTVVTVVKTDVGLYSIKSLVGVTLQLSSGLQVQCQVRRYITERCEEHISLHLIQFPENHCS